MGGEHEPGVPASSVSPATPPPAPRRPVGRHVLGLGLVAVVAAVGCIASRVGDDAASRVTTLRSFVFGILAITVVLLVAEGLSFRPGAQEDRRRRRIRDGEDVTVPEDDRRRLSHEARFDPLTGLINRVLFGDRLQNAITRAQRDGGLVSLMDDQRPVRSQRRRRAAAAGGSPARLLGPRHRQHRPHRR
jgi:hypothetical protein